MTLGGEKDKIRGLAAAHGWKVTSIRRIGVETFQVQMYEQRMYQEPSGRELKISAPLEELRSAVYDAVVEQ